MAGTSLAHSFQPTKTSNPRRQSGIRAFKRTSTDDEQVEKTAVAQRIEPAPRPIWDSIPTAFPPGQSGAGFGALGAGSINYCLAPICYTIQNLLKSDEMQGRMNAFSGDDNLDSWIWIVETLRATILAQ